MIFDILGNLFQTIESTTVSNVAQKIVVNSRENKKYSLHVDKSFQETFSSTNLVSCVTALFLIAIL